MLMLLAIALIIKLFECTHYMFIWHSRRSRHFRHTRHLFYDFTLARLVLLKILIKARNLIFFIDFVKDLVFHWFEHIGFARFSSLLSSKILGVICALHIDNVSQIDHIYVVHSIQLLVEELSLHGLRLRLHLLQEEFHRLPFVILEKLVNPLTTKVPTE